MYLSSPAIPKVFMFFQRVFLTPSPRAKPTVSYAEPPSSSDLDDDSDSDSGNDLAGPSSRHVTKARTQPKRSSQRVRTYKSDESEDSEEEFMAPERSNTRQSRHSTRNAVATRDTNTNKFAESIQFHPKRTRASLARYSDDSEDERPKTKKRKSTRPLTPKSPKRLTKSSTTPIIIGSRVIPKWQSLPYHILLQIFKYAAYPLYDVRSFQPSPSATWLLNMARLCREYTEPALTALYSSPPLVPMIQAHRLVDILRKDPLQMAFGYRQKIESLHIDVGQVVAYSLSGSGHLDVRDLIKDLPRLADLELYHQKDMWPYRELNHNIRWTYPESLFNALEYVDPAADPLLGDKTSYCKLKSWRWSSRLAGKMWGLDKMLEVHLKPSFATLRKISFVNYNILDPEVDEPVTDQILLADSLKPLKNLEHLVFESSEILTKHMLPLLPKNLRHLELINCVYVTAEILSEFLLTHGRQLRTLTLNHNQWLNLSFLSILEIACPHLEILKMNLAFPNTIGSFRDSEPEYKQLLLPDQVPVWPKTLQAIELTQLRKWETDAAEMFFQSLLDSAASLPDLRRLTLQCILSIGWRDRASFREKWIGSLDQVFKRISPFPQHITSIRPATTPQQPTAPRIKISSMSSTSTLTVQTPSAPSATSPTRRSHRTAPTPGLYAESPDASDAEPDSLPITRRPNSLSRELAILKQTAGIDSPLDQPSSPISSTSDSDEPITKSRKEKGKAKDVQIQGMCEIVEVRIDNLRPAEFQHTEADFLDEEASGDEDWNGEDIVEGEGEYAWR